ncbi:nuA3 HAT complex component nto1 [Dissophora globulifera]|nr:nuA3 HAT complex component nto1 [Dissophora globulifera]
MPRLEPVEADAWYAKVKALPFHSPDFNCILPGCPNSYQTKQGLERHFVSIHMPKAESSTKPVRKEERASPVLPLTATITPTPTTTPTAHYANSHRRSSGGGGRKVRIRSHRKGRPPGSGHKARLKEQELHLALDQALAAEESSHHHIPDPHPNHTLLANHPASSHHDHGDDDSKPREERSYLEFFPFLNASLRLEIVDAAREHALAAAGADRKASTSEASHLALPTVKSETKDADTASSASAEVGIVNVRDSQAPSEDTFHDSIDPLLQQTSHANGDPSHSTGQAEDMEGIQLSNANADENPDVDAISDPDVFFDANGFVDSEAELSQKAIPHSDGSDSGRRDSAVGPEADEPEPMDTDVVVVSKPEQKESGAAEDLMAQETQELKNGEQPHAPPVSTTTSSRKAASSAAVAALKPKTPPSQLPKSSFRLIPREDDDLEEYHLPACHNVRYIEPTETELAERVEYDMDEQDEFWLREINAERRKQDLGEVSSSMFEKIIDRLEKEWFDLTKNIPKTAENLPPEDSACNICDDGECENSNAIVFCDGCNLAVHQDCYGIPYIPEGQWLCRKCMLSPQMPVSCIFCPGEGGAFKQTTNSRWAHLLCASWIPEVGVANTVYMEPIDNIEKIPASRWKLTCYICKLRMGACIQCETKNCFRAFHVTCARRAHLYMKSKLSKASGSGGEVLTYRAHCHKHTPRDYKGLVDLAGAAAVFAHKGLKKKKAKIRVLDDDSDDPDYGRSDDDSKSNQRQSSSHEKGPTSLSSLSASKLSGSRMSKAALAHQKHYTPGAPLAPMFIVNRLLPFVGKLGAKTPALRKVSALNFVHTVCKYWSLKRESRRGAPLLKRLHLEPWTASASAHRQTEEEKLKKLQTQLLLRGDLEKVRMLAELVRKRERAKLKRQELQNRYLCKIMFPLKTILEDTLSELEKLDRQKYFAYPISAEEVKDYHDVIKDPISFQTMNEKLVAHKYQTVEEFTDDARRIYQNCLIYNKVDTPYYRAASRQMKQAEPLLEKAKEEYEHLEIDPRTGFLAVPIDPEILTYNLVPFQKEDGDEKSLNDDPPASDAASAKASSTTSRRRDLSIEPPRVPVVTGRALRATAGRSAPTSASPSQASRSSGSTTPQAGRQALNQTAGFRAPSRLPLRPEVPKPKTATLTRADLAKARQTSDEGTSALVDLDEEGLLEKLKMKSKKSRSLAVNLQSRLKPSIVDKVKEVINKPAPKGWAYVVVEGEEDTSEGEEGAEPNPPDLDSEAEMAEKAREEARRKRREERHASAMKKKMIKEKKAKARAEAYAKLKASRLLAASSAIPADEAVPSESKANGEQEARSSRSNTTVVLSSKHLNGTTSRQSKSKSKKRQSHSSAEEANGSYLDASEQESSRIPSEELAYAGQDLDAEFSVDPLSNGLGDDASGSDTNGSPRGMRGFKGKGKRADLDEVAVSNGLAGLMVSGTDDDRGHRREVSEDAEFMSADGDEEEHDTFDEEEPPRKRQKRAGLPRIGATDAPEDEVRSGNTRRLRSTEVNVSAPAPLGSRRGSSSQRGASKGIGDTAAKRRRSESSDGSPKKQKSDRHGGPLSYGSLVWAKMEGFPWFPAEVMDPKGPKVPAQALEMKRDGQGAHLVQFFDLRERGERGRSWYWVSTAQISPLGVDLDEDYKRVHLKAGWNPKRRKTVKQAYMDACQVKKMDPTLVLDEQL